MDQELVLNPFANWLREHRNLAAFAVGVAACCVWILSLPVFPSEDGPVHVYYATVMTTLLSGAHGPRSAMHSGSAICFRPTAFTTTY
jgi:hypothetical protein